MERTNEKPQLAAGAAVGTFPTVGRGGAALMLPRTAATVKDAGREESLSRQATAAEARTRATADWHRERAARYLPWIDLPWADKRYRFHVDQAAYQDSLAARHAAIRQAMGEVFP